MLRAINAELQARVDRARSTEHLEPKAYQLRRYTNEPIGDEPYPSYIGYDLNSITYANNRAAAVLSINCQLCDQIQARLAKHGIRRCKAMDIVDFTAEYTLHQFQSQHGVEFDIRQKQHVAELTDMILANLFDTDNDTMHIKEYTIRQAY